VHKISTDQLTYIVIGFVIIVLVELSFFNNGGVVLLIIGALLLYFHFKTQKRFLLWIGALFLLLALLNLWTLRLFILGTLIYLMYKQFTKSVEFITFTQPPLNATVERKKLIGMTPPAEEAYEWKDVQIQRLLGDITIDVTETILPAGKSFISIQQAIGNVRILVPYEVQVRLHYTTIYGEACCMNAAPKRLINEQLQFEDGYDAAKRTLVIYVASWIGDVEVQRA